MMEHEKMSMVAVECSCYTGSAKRFIQGCKVSADAVETAVAITNLS
jgi:hypothetical protein